MFRVGKPVHLSIPAESRDRVLHQGEVREVDGQTVVAEFVDAVFPLPQSRVELYGELRGKFCQQAAMVVAMRETTPNPAVEFKTVGEPVVRESRTIFRVSTISVEMTATIDNGDAFKVVDISSEGFAAIGKAAFAPGSLVTVSLMFEGETCTDKARIQTCRTLPNGMKRYGVLALAGEGAPLRKNLGRLTGLVQRTQLKRLSGAW